MWREYWPGNTLVFGSAHKDQRNSDASGTMYGRIKAIEAGMSERARIISWWVYVALVIAIFEVVFQLTNFAYAVGAALVAMVVLGVALKLVVGHLVRRGTRASGGRKSPSGKDIM